MEPLHQLHSSTYEVDRRQPLMYPYKVHYQNGPISEYRKEFPSKNDRDDSSWKQSQPSVNLHVLKSSACSSDSSNEKTMIERERTIITENEWAMRVMQSNQMNDVFRWVEGYRIQVANVITEIERLREHNTLLRDKAHDKIRWHEGEMKKMGLGMAISFYLFAHIINAFFPMLDRSRTLVSALRKHRSSVSSRKSVRFADSLGLYLEKLEYFTRDEENLFAHNMPNMSSCSPVASTTVVSHRLFPTNFVYRSESESISRNRLAHVNISSLRTTHAVYDKNVSKCNLLSEENHIMAVALILLRSQFDTRWMDGRPISNCPLHSHTNYSGMKTSMHSHSYSPFHIRFALMEEKIILAWIFRQFKIKSSERRF
ncbi:hypothetical protein PRIPAC_79962, partial [Pristionchus pacificus]|uniref:Uncharacterized protein n=1 Tax=Pristionchus pacificus TaxID=54126 RepID=A0A2A6CLB6_PRIPA